MTLCVLMLALVLLFLYSPLRCALLRRPPFADNETACTFNVQPCVCINVSVHFVPEWHCMELVYERRVSGVAHLDGDK